MKRRPTISDVADAAGVSRGTVSRVLNGGRWVSPEAQAAVTAAIASTGYRVNPHARSLATSRTNSVGFLLTEPPAQLFDDPNFAVLLQGVAHALEARDLSLVVLMAGSAAEQRRATDYILQGHVDGVLLVSWHASGGDLVETLYRADVPVVACGVPIDAARRIGWVAADDRGGAAMAVEHLRSLGRTRIATIAGPQDMSGGSDRLAGYRDAIGDLGDERLVVFGDYSTDSGAAAMRALLEVDPALDAVFAANDRMAAGALAVLAQQGRRVPEDVAVIGFDDADVATRTTPTLTTLQQPFERITQEMVRLLGEVIAGEAPATIRLPTKLVIRESA